MPKTPVGIASISLIILFAALAVAPSARGELNRDGLKDDGRWVFTGSDGDQSGGSVNDPMTTLYMGGRFWGRSRLQQNDSPYETTKNVRETIRRYWEGRGDFEGRVCNQGKWLGMRGHGRDKTDLNLSTSISCKNQWHTRIWNDKEINGDDVSDAKWEVGGIHRETRGTFEFGDHRLSYSFEEAEAKYLRGLKTCHKKDWRVLPGSAGLYSRTYGEVRTVLPSNGRISRISMTPLDNPLDNHGRCHGAWAR